MDFRLLGPLEVWRDEELVPIRPPRQRALLALLLLRANKVVSQEELIDELWGGDQPRTARQALHNAVLGLRRTLGRDVLETQPSGYRLRVTDGQLDLERFEYLIEQARGRPPAERGALLREALALWRGLPLVEFPFEPALQAEVLRLEELHLGAIEARIESDLAVGRHVEIVPELEALTAQHPLRETLWQQLMLALYRAGRQGDAVATYRAAHNVFAAELGIEPSPKLKDLQRAILLRDRSLEGNGDGDILERAAAVMPSDDRGRAQSLRDLGVALWALGERKHANVILTQSARWAASAGDSVLEEGIRLQLAAHEVYEGTQETAEHLRDALAAAEVFREAGDDDALAHALTEAGTRLRDLGRCEQATPLLEEALAAATRCGNRAREGLTRGLLGTVLGIGPEPVPKALARCEQLRDDWRGDKLPGVEIGLGLLKLQAGSEGEGLRHLETAVNRTRALGRPATLSGTMSFVAYADEIRGDLDAMAVALREAHDLVDSLGDQASVAFTAARLARARALLGDTDEATQLLNVAEAAAPETDVDETERLRARAALAAQEGRAAIAFEHAAAAVALSERTDLPNLHGAALEDLASIAPDHERRDILGRALRAYEQKGNSVASARVRDTLSRCP